MVLCAGLSRAEDIAPEWLLEAAPPTPQALHGKAPGKLTAKPPATQQKSPRPQANAKLQLASAQPRKARRQYQYTLIGGC